jgi:hypothetical protein
VHYEFWFYLTKALYSQHLSPIALTIFDSKNTFVKINIISGLEHVMKKLVSAIAGLALMPMAATAQTKTALEVAQELDACKGSQVISATYLPTGEISASCPAGNADGTGADGSGALVGGLSPGVAIVLVVLAAALVAAASGSSTSDTQ